MLETTRLLRDLVRLPSVNPMGRPLTGDHLYDQSQNVGAEVRVDILCTGATLEWGAQDERSGFERSLCNPPDISACRKSGGVCQQLANGDFVLVTAAECWDVVHDRVIEPDLLFIEQDHDRRRGADDLG